MRSFGLLVQETCPVHMLGPLIDGARKGDRLFSGITAASALTTLRFLLSQLGVESAADYRTHDLRRGHAQDLVELNQV